MEWTTFKSILLIIQHIISFAGVLIILAGVCIALCQFLGYLMTGVLVKANAKVNHIRLNLGRILTLGLEFIVAADLIGTTTTPDYYALGMLAIIVAIRILLNYSLNRELATLTKKQTNE